MATPIDVEKLRNDLASSREGLTAYVAALRHDLDFGAKLKRGVRDNPLPWYAAAGVIGLLLSKIPPMQRKVVVKGPKQRADAPQEAGKAAITVTVLKYALDFAKPALLRWIKDRFLGAGRSSRKSGIRTT